MLGFALNSSAAGTLTAVARRVAMAALVLTVLTCAIVTPSARASSGVVAALGLNENLGLLACATATSCTAISVDDNRVVTFNPRSPKFPLVRSLVPRSDYESLSCPSRSQCTAVDSHAELTFDPTSRKRTRSIDLSVGTGGQVLGVACPSVSQCTAVTAYGTAVTFDPAAARTSQRAASLGTDVFPNAIACPSTVECVAVDGNGTSLTFDPSAPSGSVEQTVYTGSGAGNASVVCPSASLCVAAFDDSGGHAAAFNPQSPSDPPSVIPLRLGRSPSLALSCGSPSVCSAVDGSGRELTFVPGASVPEHTAFVDPCVEAGQCPEPDAIACPSASQCTAVDGVGREITFDPASPGHGSEATVVAGPGYTLTSVACPSVFQCSAADGGDTRITFNPRRVGPPASEDPFIPPKSKDVDVLACPSVTQCIGLGPRRAITFAPHAAFDLSSIPIPHTGPRAQAVALACPSIHQCTVITGRWEITLDPLVPVIKTAAPISSGKYQEHGRTFPKNLAAIACPGVHQCTAMDTHDAEYTFDPLRPRIHQHVTLATPVVTEYGPGYWYDNALFDLACHSSTQCTAVGNNEVAMTFDPQKPSRRSPLRGLGTITTFVSGLECPTAQRCITLLNGLGRQPTRELTFNSEGLRPSAPRRVDLLRSTRYYSLSCPDAELCITVGENGREVTFRPR